MQMYGSAFFRFSLGSMKSFTKPYLSVAARITLLKARSRTITDDAQAAGARERIGHLGMTRR